jgi:hypothetical protein
MSIKSSDVAFYYSGQSSSIGVPDSIGGEPSTIPVADRLFKNVTNQEAIDGVVDYKCFYIANKNPEDTFYNLNLSLRNSSSSHIQFGLPGVHSAATESCATPPCADSTVQYLYLTTPAGVTKITGGEFGLIYGGFSDPVELGIQWSWSNSLTEDQNLLNTAVKIKAAFSIIPEFANVIVEPMTPVLQSNGGKKYSFKITFEAGRYIALLNVKSINYLSPQGVNITVDSSVVGGPINRVADVIESSKVAPNITFLDPSSTVFIKHFYPSDYIPVWIKRTIFPNSVAIDQDNFSILISASNSEIEPTPTPTYVALDAIDQSQVLYDGGLQVIPNITYWQSFTCSKTGVLSQLEIALYSDPIPSSSSTGSIGNITPGSVAQTSYTAISGTGSIKIYTGEGVNILNLVSSSSNVSVNVANSLITWNNFKVTGDVQSVGLSVTKNTKYTFAYTPNFIHKIAINYQNPYNGGIFGVNSTSFPDVDMLFKTHILEDYTPPDPTPTLTPTITPTLTPSFVLPH